MSERDLLAIMAAIIYAANRADHAGYVASDAVRDARVILEFVPKPSPVNMGPR